MIKLQIADIQLHIPPMKVAVFFNHDTLINYVDSVGVDWLEEEKVFVLCFDTTPTEDIPYIRDYKKVSGRYPTSNRVMGESFYIGNYEEGDWGLCVSELLENFSPRGQFPEVVHMEKEYTYPVDKGETTC